MTVDYGTNTGQPDLFDRALAARAAELRNVRIRSCLSLKPRAVLEADPHGEHFLWSSWHFSGYDRRMHDAGRCDYVPMNFGEAPAYYRRFLDPVDVACIKTTPMDEHGYFNFGGAVTYHKALCEREGRDRRGVALDAVRVRLRGDMSGGGLRDPGRRAPLQSSEPSRAQSIARSRR